MLLKVIRTLTVSADMIFYPEIQHTDREREQLLHMIQLCNEKEIKIATATVKALLDKTDAALLLASVTTGCSGKPQIAFNISSRLLAERNTCVPTVMTFFT